MQLNIKKDIRSEKNVGGHFLFLGKKDKHL